MGMNDVGKHFGDGTNCANGSNPDPKVFKILKQEKVRNYLVVFINYPNAKNFEGNKILVYEGWGDTAQIISLTNSEIDPHFDNTPYSPVARFIPKNEGWKMAIDFCKSMAFIEDIMEYVND